MKTKTTLWLLAFGTAALLATGSCKKKDEAPAAPPAPAATAEAGATAPAGDAQAWFVCPMAECHYAQKGPGKCPKCGMDLTPAAVGWLPSEGAESGSCTATSCGCPMVAGAQAQAAALAAQTAKELAPEKIGQQATCPVTGETFTVTEATPAVAYEGKTYLFCCMGCVPKFLADPAKFAAAAAAAPTTPLAAAAAPLEIKTAGELAPEKIGQQATCPIHGDTFTVAAETPAVTYNGQVVLFGCMGCANAFAANPENPAPPSCPHHGAGH
jgi:YHS domain-containing protein